MQYEHNVSSTYASRSQTLTKTLPGSSRFLCFSVLQRVHRSCKTARKLRNWWVVEWEWIFQKQSNFLVQKQKCGISSNVFSCGSGTAEIQVTVYLYETAELQVTDCSVCESRTAELRDIVYSLCGSETAELQVTEYSLCGGGTAGLKVKALVWKRNCETSKSY